MNADNTVVLLLILLVAHLVPVCHPSSSRTRQKLLF